MYSNYTEPFGGFAEFSALFQTGLFDTGAIQQDKFNVGRCALISAWFDVLNVEFDTKQATDAP